MPRYTVPLTAREIAVVARTLREVTQSDHPALTLLRLRVCRDGALDQRAYNRALTVFEALSLDVPEASQ